VRPGSSSEGSAGSGEEGSGKNKGVVMIEDISQDAENRGTKKLLGEQLDSHQDIKDHNVLEESKTADNRNPQDTNSSRGTKTFGFRN
jgi:hypothetical protein